MLPDNRQLPDTNISQIYLGCDGGIDSDFRFRFRSHETHFHVHILRERSGNVGTMYLAKLQNEEFEEEVIDFITDLCRPLLHNYYLQKSLVEQQSLDKILYPRIIDLFLAEENGKPVLYHLEESPFFTIMSTVPTKSLPSHIPICKPSEIIIIDRLDISQVFKALLNDELVCVKVAGTHGSEALTREVFALHTLGLSALPETINVPRLRGLVQAQDNATEIVGLVMDYIEHEQTLADVDLTSIPGELRERWSDNICKFVKHLHSMSLTWGDVKPQNILKDPSDNLWMIDFGGGATPGWVEQHLTGSIMGDMQGLGKIKSMLLSHIMK